MGSNVNKMVYTGNNIMLGDAVGVHVIFTLKIHGGGWV